MDTQTKLQEPILDGGIRSINYFTGRLLTAQDLSREHIANREADHRLGRAMGDGVAYGLEVSVSLESKNDAPALQVESGLAVNRKGQTLALQNQIALALVRQPAATTVTDSSNFFAECTPIQTGTYVAGGRGVYLLTIAPAEKREGRALVSGLGNEAAACNTDTIVEAVQFRLIQIDSFLNQGELTEPNESLIRNRIAYRCFGVNELKAFTANPFGTPLERYGLLDELRGSVLSDCDVPLAVIFWTLSGGIRFVDMWAVRRRLAKRSFDDRLNPDTGDRRLKEAEAIVFQFQEQVDDLAVTNNTVSMPEARQLFRYLPPIGLLIEPSGRSLSGFDYLRFLNGLTYRNPVFIEGARIEPLFRLAMSFRPIDLTTGEMIWLYRVRENRQVSTQSRFARLQPYLIFTSGHVPYQGDARYNLARWDYSNYSSAAFYGV